MPDWLLVGFGVTIGLAVIVGALWWATVAERKPGRWLPSQKDQPDSGTWWGGGGSHHGGGDFGGGGHH